MDGGHRVNVAVIGSLKDDATAFKPAQTFGIERQIAQANSRIMSAMPGVRTVTGEDGRVHIRLDADTVQQRHHKTCGKARKQFDFCPQRYGCCAWQRNAL